MVSSIDNQNITTDYELLENDYINILFNNYDLFNCTIRYTYIVTEPDYEIFDEYPEEIDITYGNNSVGNFNLNKQNYTGRLSYYSLYLNNTLTDECNDKCKLCYDDLQKKCIVCDYGYTIKINK